MDTCEALGEMGDFLKPFENIEEYVKFSNLYLKNAAIHKYCDNGGRYNVWLPFKGWMEKNGSFNVTHYKTNKPYLMNDAWMSNKPETTGEWFCVSARLDKAPTSSWRDAPCMSYDWFQAPCSACSFPNSIGNDIVFNLRGLCERWVFQNCSYSFLIITSD